MGITVRGLRCLFLGAIAGLGLLAGALPAQASYIYRLNVVQPFATVPGSAAGMSGTGVIELSTLTNGPAPPGTASPANVVDFAFTATDLGDSSVYNFGLSDLESVYWNIDSVGGGLIDFDLITNQSVLPFLWLTLDAAVRTGGAFGGPVGMLMTLPAGETAPRIASGRLVIAEPAAIVLLAFGLIVLIGSSRRTIFA